MPHYRFETEAGGRVAGVDEVGRGPLAGPVVAAAVVLQPQVPRRLAARLNDSKQLDEAARDDAYASLRRAEARGEVQIAVGAASVAEIVRLNILHAAMLAMARAVGRLPALPDLALVDGSVRPPLPCDSRCVVDGDATCLSIAAASIVAKVTRDRLMRRLAARFPHYGWASNVGYGTIAHRAALRALGPTRHHRPTFGTVRILLAGGD